MGKYDKAKQTALGYEDQHHLIIVGRNDSGKTIALQNIINLIKEERKVELFVQYPDDLKYYDDIIKHENVKVYTLNNHLDFQSKMNYYLFRPKEKVTFVLDEFNKLDPKFIHSLFLLTQPNMKIVASTSDMNDYNVLENSSEIVKL